MDTKWAKLSNPYPRLGFGPGARPTREVKYPNSTQMRGGTRGPHGNPMPARFRGIHSRDSVFKPRRPEGPEVAGWAPYPGISGAGNGRPVHGGGPGAWHAPGARPPGPEIPGTGAAAPIWHPAPAPAVPGAGRGPDGHFRAWRFAYGY